MQYQMVINSNLNSLLDRFVDNSDGQNHWTERRASGNSTYPKGGDSCSKDSFVVNQTLVFQIKFCGKSPTLRVAAKRYVPLASGSATYEQYHWFSNT
jgi:hypothetical protein